VRLSLRKAASVRQRQEVRQEIRGKPHSIVLAFVFLILFERGKMKQDRHTAIRELVAGALIGSQDELRRRLVKRGFEVTQATLSRDIHELHLYKGPNGYAVPNGVAFDEEDSMPGTAEMLSSFGLRVKQALNQLVLITTSGSAQPVALAIDGEDWPEVVGTIAGDDTVLIICPDQKRATLLKERLEVMIG
jgi:transcriptional regulator of arginine metabolism